jgi:glycosyltransferase involved in cell wall biosynthesis
MPVDTTIFFPDVKKVIPGRIGFSGRLDDPRKNITLLLQAIKYCKDKGLNITADLIGNKPDAKLQAHVDYMGLTDSINFIPYIPHEELPLHLRILDVFVIPSHQEGLCIAGLEAMASGCPVISTRCGGPEEYVIEGQTGYLVNFDTESMGNAISKIVNDRNLRLRLSENARLFVKKHYNLSIAKEKFWEAFEKTFH